MSSIACARPRRRPAPDPMRPDAVPVAREMPAPELARNIRPDGTLPFLFDGLRVPVPLPPLAGAILDLIDGQRTRGRDRWRRCRRGAPRRTRPRRAWRQTYDALSRVNRILLAAPP